MSASATVLASPIMDDLGLDDSGVRRGAPLGRRNPLDDFVLDGHRGLPLLQGKIMVPTVPGQVIARPRLFAELSAAQELPLTTLLAPAGWGKTLLLCSWLRAEPPRGRVAWLSLDAGDNDPVRFLAYVLSAIREDADLPADHPLVALSPPLQADSQVLDGFLALLVNGLATLDEPVTLIIDDVHELESESTLRSLSFLLRNAPQQVRILLAGRSLAGISLGRMRVAGRVAEIGAEQLAFTDEEVVQIFAAEEKAIPRDRLIGLRQRAEGWPAGIRLAQMSLRGAADPTARLADFSGDINLVVDYLMSEVLEQLEPELVDFLLRTSIVDRLDADIAATLSGREDSAQVLEQMEQANAFVVAQGKQPAYRYHQLFREMLQHRLQREQPTEVPELHRRAAAWFADNDRTTTAARHAIAAGDWVITRTVMRLAWIRLFLDGELSTLTNLLGQIPEHVMQGDAELSSIRAAVRLSVDEAGSAVADLLRADRLAHQADEELGESYDMVRAMVALDQARLASDVAGARAAAATLLSSPEVVPEVRALAQLHLGVTEYFNGDRTAAERCLRDGLALAESIGRDYLALGCLSQLTIVLTAQDRPREALKIANQASYLAEQRGWSETLQMAVGTWHAMGWIHYLWGEPEKAEMYLDRAEEAARSGDGSFYGCIHMVQALSANLSGDRVRALSLLDASTAAIDSGMESFIFAPYIRGERVRILLSLGQTERARRELAALGPEAGARTHIRLARAELQIADHDLGGALATLAPAISGEAEGFLDQALQAQILTAIVLEKLGRLPDAANALNQAVTLAAPEGFKQPFLQFGERARAMLARLSPEKSLRPFVTDLLASFGAVGGERSASTSNAETLTEREVEVLVCLSDMMTTPEIAAELFVSVNTVKAHLKHIYTKLNVSSRRQAVARGRALGLLD